MNNCPTNTCISNYSAECVIYHLHNDTPSKLSNLNLPNGSDVATILEKVDTLVGNNYSIVLNKVDTPSVAITLNGPTIKADSKISAVAGNLVEIKDDGLYVKSADGKVKTSEVDSTSNYLKYKIVGGTNGIISVSVTEAGGVLSIVPSLNIEALLLAISADPALLTHFKNM